MFHNSLKWDKILVVTKFKGFADVKFSFGKMMISVFEIVESIMGNGKNDVSLQRFQKASMSGLLKLGIVWLSFSQTTNFRHSQTERVCRRQFQNLIKMGESSPKG